MHTLTDGFARGLAGLAAVCIGALMMITVVDVIRRNLTGSALAGTVEYSELLMVSLVFLGLALAQRDKEHVAVNLVTSRLPRPVSRILRVSGLGIVLALLAWMTLETAKEAYRSFISGEIRIGLQSVRVWPARALIPIGLAALVMQLIADVVAAAKGDPPATAPSTDPVVPL
ncbi:hypothetical protein BH23ACT9_BH23ACT9_07290 [soil metagenome]